MLPRFTASNFSNAILANPELPTKACVGEKPCWVRANLPHLSLVQLGVLNGCSFSLPILAKHVVNVVSVCTWEQIARIETGRYITAMKNLFAVRYWANKCFISIAMS